MFAMRSVVGDLKVLLHSEREPSAIDFSRQHVTGLVSYVLFEK